MKRYQIYKNGRVIKDTNSRNAAFRYYVVVHAQSNKENDCVEVYDSLTGEVFSL